MRRIGAIIFQIYIAGALMGSATFAQKKTVIPSVSISGQTNFDDSYIALVSDFRGKDNKSSELPLSKNGTFKWRSDLKTPGFVMVSIFPKARNRQLAASFPLYVQSGSNILLNISYSDSTYLTLLPGKLDGNNKALIQYSNFCSLKMREMFRNRVSSVDQIKPAITPFFTQAEKYIAEYGVKNKAVKEYLDVWAMNHYISNLFNLPRDFRRNYKEAELPADYYSFPKSPATVYNYDAALLFNETSMNVNAYLNFITRNTTEKKDLFEGLKLKFRRLDSLFSNKVLVNKLILSNLESFISGYAVKDDLTFESDLAKYRELVEFVAGENKKAELVSTFSNLKYTLKGSSMPDIAFKDALNNDIKLQSLAAGKYIYIDLWASWCKPCIAEIPNLHQLEADYKDKNIVFVSISLDEDKKAWKDKMAELKLEGNQLEVGASGFEKIMNVTGIPHFILYGPTGKLLMYRAPRPGTAEIRAFLDKSLSPSVKM